MVPMLDKMEQEGLLERRPSPNDRRSNSIWLTEKGRDLLVKVRPLVLASEERLGQGFSKLDKAQLLSLLKRVQDNLQEAKP